MRLAWTLAALAYMAAIFFVSSQTGDSVGVPAPWDKVAHFAEYAGLAFVLSRATGGWRSALVIAAWWGALDEVHQAFVPMRMAGLPDWIADLAGSAVGAWAGTLNRRRTPPVAPG